MSGQQVQLVCTPIACDKCGLQTFRKRGSAVDRDIAPAEFEFDIPYAYRLPSGATVCGTCMHASVPIVLMVA